MDKLIAKSACSGLLPITIGTLTVKEIIPEVITSLAPLKGQEAALSKSLKAKHGIALPQANEMTRDGAVMAVWGGSHVYLMGAAPDASVSAVASLTDQTDAWSVVSVAGPDIEALFARLTSVDGRLAQFPVGRSIRTQLKHMNVILVRTETEEFTVMAFRSMAKTLVHDLSEAMTSLKARTAF